MPENAKRGWSPPSMEFESVFNASLAFGLKRNHYHLADLIPVLSFLVKVTVDFGAYLIVLGFITAI